MVNRPPEHCPRCGTNLTAVDPPTVHRCPECDRPVYHNPIPTAQVAVLDGDALLLVKVDTPERDLWGTPGGMLEGGEDPDAAGARELREETTLSVDPDDLVLFDARTFEKFGTTLKTYLNYAVDAADVDGTPEADDEVAAARFWTPAEFARAEDRTLTSWPAPFKNVEWWVEEGQSALERD